ncbi:UNVERIFIED_CONTAM: hypothetical protein DES50_106171 [Williamsia faeni]
MTPTYDQVSTWKPHNLSIVATAVRELQDTLSREAPNAGNPVLNLTSTQWQGLSRTASDERAESITRWLRNAADISGDLATTLEDSDADIRGAMDALGNGREAAALQGYLLSTGDSNYNVSFSEDNAPEGNEYDAQTAREWQGYLLGLGQAADTAVTNANTAIGAALDNLTGVAPASIAQNSATIDPTRAAADAEAILDGTATPEQRARFIQATRLTPEQLAKLEAGERIEIPPNQLEYIRLATGMIDVGNGQVSGIGAFEKFGTRPGEEPLRSSLANGLQILSNEKVHAGDTQGGYGALPQSIKDVIVAGGSPLGASLTDSQRVTLQRAGVLGNLLNTGDPRYQAGTEIDRGLGELALNYTDFQATHEQQLYGSGLNPNDFGSLQDVLETVGQDKQWVHAAFTGSGGADVIHDLMTVQFTDDGKAAGEFWRISEDSARFTDWGTPSDARTADQRADFATSERSGEILDAMLRYAGSPEGYSSLMDIPGVADNQSVGQLNPEALRILAETLKPYAAELGDQQDSSLVGFNDADPGMGDSYRNLLHQRENDFEGGSRIFALLGTDEVAAKNFYGAVYDQIAEESVAYAKNPDDGDAADRLALMAHLRGLSDEGLLYAAQDAAGDDYEAAQKAYEMKSNILDDFVSISDLVTDKAPGSSILLDLVENDLRNSLLGPSPDSKDFDAENYKAHLGQSGATGDAVNDLRAAIVTATDGDIRSVIDPDWVKHHEGWFNSDGTLRTRQEIVDYQDDNGARPYNAGAFDRGARTILDQIAQTKNSNPGYLNDDYLDVWATSEELDSKWDLPH